MITAHCVNCGDVDFDTIKRTQVLRLKDNQNYIECVTTVCCDGCNTKTVDVTPYGLGLFCDSATVREWEKQRVPIQRKLDL